MRNVTQKLMNSWWALTGAALSVPVYIESVPEEEDGNYVLLRVESETDVTKNAKTWVKEVVVIADVVTRFNVAINTETADGIHGEIGILLADGPGHNHNLATQTGIQINSVTEETVNPLQEDDGTEKIYRKVIRYNHLITIQL